MENRKSISILHLWPSPSLFSPLFSSGTMWESRYPFSWPYFPCGWHNLLPLHCVFLYGGLFPHWLAHSPVSGKWHVVWHSSKLHKWVFNAQKHERRLVSCLLVLWNTLNRPLCSTLKIVKWSVSDQWDVFSGQLYQCFEQRNTLCPGWSCLSQSHLHLHWESQDLLSSLSEIEQKSKWKNWMRKIG